MNQPRRCTATKALLFVAAALAATVAWAGQVAGTVTHLSGPLLAKKADGAVKVLSQKSTVEQGDTLVTEKDTYARIKFIDDSEMTLRPNSQVKIDDFSFEDDQPQKDKASFSLIKGGLRAVTGTLGKRNKEKFGVNTPTATIGIRGTIFIAEYVPPESAAVAAYGFASLAAIAPVSYLDRADSFRSDVPLQAAPVEILPIRLAQGMPSVAGRAPGLYVQVLNGMVSLTNQGGSQNFAAGQFGHAPSMVQPPVILPANPGIKFEPPPAFSMNTGPQDNGAPPPQQKGVDCEVR